MNIAEDDFVKINKSRLNKVYADKEAAIRLFGSHSKGSLIESLFGKDGYWTY